MALTNNWVTYLDRSYKSIKASLISRLQSIVPEITDYSESNILVIILEMFAGLTEQLNYYIDNVAREAYITTARRYSSLIKLTKLIDYRVKAKIGAIVDLKITAVDSSGDPVLLVNDFNLSAGLIVRDSAGIEFIIEKASTIFSNTSSVIVGARQRVEVTGDNIGTTTSDPNQSFQLHDDYQHDTLQITINSLTWSLVQSFAFSGPEDRHFIVDVDELKQATLRFGDGINGDIPPASQSVIATYYTCSGINGRLPENTITLWDSTPTPPVQTPTISSITVTNELPSVGGLNEEGIDEIRRRAPLSLRTLDRAVTQQDHDDLCLLVPGVGKAISTFDTQLKTVTFYVAPDGGGTAPAQLLSDVESYFSTRKMISTVVEAFASGETKLRMTLVVYAKFRRNLAQTEADINEALKTEFGFNNSTVDRKIRQSDIIALIDNLDKVDYLSLSNLTTKPYPRISLGSNQLEDNWRITVNTSSTETISWRLSVSASTTARLYRTASGGTEVFDRSFTIVASDPGSPSNNSTNGYITISVWGTFSIGDTWLFKTYAFGEDIVFDDYTIPVYEESEISLSVNEQVGI